MNMNNPLAGILQALMSNVSERISEKAVAKVPFFKGTMSDEFMQEAVITDEGNVFLRHLVGKNIPATPITFHELEEIYHAAKAQIEKINGSAKERARSENFPLSDPLYDIKNSSRWAKSLARHEANNWPHPGISGTYELPSGNLSAYVSRDEKTIDLRNVHTGGTLLATISFDDISRLGGIAFPSVLPDGPNGCPVPQDDEKHFTFVGYVAKNVNGEWGTADKKLISPIDLIAMVDPQLVTFTSDLSAVAPDGKVPVYCVYDKVLAQGGCLGHDPFSLETSTKELKEIEEILNVVGENKILLAVAFVDKN